MSNNQNNIESNILSRRHLGKIQIDTGRHSNMSEISLGEIIDNYLNENTTYQDILIDMESQLPEAGQSECSKAVHLSKSDATSNSIPSKLRKFYSHNSFRQIILSVLSLSSITFTFVGLFSGKLDGCETLAFVSSVILLFSPSPLQLCR